jgi:uncharacterized membrane protein
MTRSRAQRCRGESGTAAVLIIGFTVVIAMMVAVVVDASAAYLRRQSLSTLADGAALAAADGIQGEQVYTSGLAGRAVIDPRLAEALVTAHLGAVDAAETYPGLRVHVDTADDRVVVRLTAPLDLPLTLPGVGDETMVSGTAAAVVAVTN